MRFIVIETECHCGTTNRLILAPGKQLLFKCNTCSRVLLEYRIIYGYVYILSNPSMDGLLKIGSTSRKISERVRDLSNATAVPTPFRVEAYYFSRSPRDDEAKVQACLSAYRVPRTEFFRIGLDEVLSKLVDVFGRLPEYQSRMQGEMMDLQPTPAVQYFVGP